MPASPSLPRHGGRYEVGGWVYLKFEESAGGKREYPGRVKAIEEGNLKVGFADGKAHHHRQPGAEAHAYAHSHSQCAGGHPRSETKTRPSQDTALPSHKPREFHGRCC